MSISKCSLVCRLVAAAGMTLVAQVASAALIFLDPPTTSPIEIGDSFSLTLSGSGFDSTLDGGGIDLAFDPAILRLTSVSVDTATWEFFSSDGIIDNATGLVSDVLFASFEERIGYFSIASFTFEALAIGTSVLTLSESLLNPFASGGELLPVEFGTLSISVVGTTEPQPVEVPMPGTLGLMLIGMMGMRLARRSRHANSTR